MRRCHLGVLVNLAGLAAFFSACAAMHLWTSLRDAVLPPDNEMAPAANDRRRAIFRDTTIFTRHFARAVKSTVLGVLSLAVFSALGIAWDGWMRIPPPAFTPCDEDLTAGLAVRDRLFTEAMHHGVWCSTRDTHTPLPCMCCLADGACWHSVALTDAWGAKRMRVTDRAWPDGVARTQELPTKVRACYYRTPKQRVAECEDEEDPGRIVALFRAVEMREGREPAGVCV